MTTGPLKAMVSSSLVTLCTQHVNIKRYNLVRHATTKITSNSSSNCKSALRRVCDRVQFAFDGDALKGDNHFLMRSGLEKARVDLFHCHLQHEWSEKTSNKITVDTEHHFPPLCYFLHLALMTLSALFGATVAVRRS